MALFDFTSSEEEDVPVTLKDNTTNSAQKEVTCVPKKELTLKKVPNKVVSNNVSHAQKKPVEISVLHEVVDFSSEDEDEDVTKKCGKELEVRDTKVKQSECSMQKVNNGWSLLADNVQTCHSPDCTKHTSKRKATESPFGHTRVHKRKSDETSTVEEKGGISSDDKGNQNSSYTKQTFVLDSPQVSIEVERRQLDYVEDDVDMIADSQEEVEYDLSSNITNRKSVDVIPDSQCVSGSDQSVRSYQETSLMLASFSTNSSKNSTPESLRQSTSLCVAPASTCPLSTSKDITQNTTASSVVSEKEEKPKGKKGKKKNAVSKKKKFFESVEFSDDDNASISSSSQHQTSSSTCPLSTSEDITQNTTASSVVSEKEVKPKGRKGTKKKSVPKKKKFFDNVEFSDEDTAETLTEVINIPNSPSSLLMTGNSSAEGVSMETTRLPDTQASTLDESSIDMLSQRLMTALKKPRRTRTKMRKGCDDIGVMTVQSDTQASTVKATHLDGLSQRSKLDETSIDDLGERLKKAIQKPKRTRTKARNADVSGNTSTNYTRSRNTEVKQLEVLPDTEPFVADSMEVMDCGRSNQNGSIQESPTSKTNQNNMSLQVSMLQGSIPSEEVHRKENISLQVSMSVPSSQQLDQRKNISLHVSQEPVASQEEAQQENISLQVSMSQESLSSQEENQQENISLQVSQEPVPSQEEKQQENVSLQVSMSQETHTVVSMVQELPPSSEEDISKEDMAVQVLTSSFQERTENDDVQASMFGASSPESGGEIVSVNNISLQCSMSQPSHYQDSDSEEEEETDGRIINDLSLQVSVMQITDTEEEDVEDEDVEEEENVQEEEDVEEEMEKGDATSNLQNLSLQVSCPGTPRSPEKSSQNDHVKDLNENGSCESKKSILLQVSMLSANNECEISSEKNASAGDSMLSCSSTESNPLYKTAIDDLTCDKSVFIDSDEEIISGIDTAAGENLTGLKIANFHDTVKFMHNLKKQGKYNSQLTSNASTVVFSRTTCDSSTVLYPSSTSVGQDTTDVYPSTEASTMVYPKTDNVAYPTDASMVLYPKMDDTNVYSSTDATTILYPKTDDTTILYPKTDATTIPYPKSDATTILYPRDSSTVSQNMSVVNSSFNETEINKSRGSSQNWTPAVCLENKLDNKRYSAHSEYSTPAICLADKLKDVSFQQECERSAVINISDSESEDDGALSTSRRLYSGLGKTMLDLSDSDSADLDSPAMFFKKAHEERESRKPTKKVEKVTIVKKLVVPSVRMEKVSQDLFDDEELPDLPKKGKKTVRLSDK